MIRGGLVLGQGRLCLGLRRHRPGEELSRRSGGRRKRPRLRRRGRGERALCGRRWQRGLSRGVAWLAHGRGGGGCGGEGRLGRQGRRLERRLL